MDVRKTIADAIKEAGFDPLAMSYEQGADEIMSALGLSNGACEILSERMRQVIDEKWSADHDDEHKDGSLATAAACYASPGSVTLEWPQKLMANDSHRLVWPWFKKWWKPKSHHRNCVRAGALLIAELDRLERADLTA